MLNLTAKENIENASAYIGHLRNDRLVTYPCGYRAASQSSLLEGYDPTISHGFFTEVAEEWRPRVKNTQPLQSFTLDELKHNLMLKKVHPGQRSRPGPLPKKGGAHLGDGGSETAVVEGLWLEDLPANHAESVT